MQKFKRIKREYDSWGCEVCNVPDTVVVIKSPDGEILVCIKCLAIAKIDRSADNLAGI